MLIFDPLEVRVRLDEPRLGYRHGLRMSLEEAVRVGAVAHVAQSLVNDAARALIVGYDGPSALLLERAHEWLSLAIRDNETAHDHQANGTEAQRHHALAICNWMLRNEHDSEDFAQFVEHEEKYLNWSGASKNKVEVSFILTSYVDAGALARALARYHGAGFAVPASLAGLRTEAQMSYVLSSHVVSSGYSSAEVEAALNRFLNRNVNHWLTNGLYLIVAEWMKIAHWNGRSGVSAKDALMKCYDYLPGVEPPPDRR